MSVPRPFVKVGLVGAILRAEPAHVLLTTKRRMAQAQCSSAAVQTYYMWTPPCQYHGTLGEKESNKPPDTPKAYYAVTNKVLCL